jgi:parallel beta-helix repeat protein
MDGNETTPHTNYDYDGQQTDTGANPAPGAPQVSGPRPTVEQINPEESQVNPQPIPEPPHIQYDTPPPTGDTVPPAGAKPKKELNLHIPHLRIIVLVMVLLAIFAAVFLFIQGMPATTTTTLTTSVPQANFTTLSGCAVISRPGMYIISSNFNTTIINGTCIEIDSSNVNLAGNQHTITGSGPYEGVPPFTYGIALNGVSNVTVTSVKLLRFSYGIFLNRTQHSTISTNNFTESTMAGIYMLSSSNNTIEKNYVSRSLSKEGGINIQSGGNNLLRNNTVINNAYYGLVVNTTGNRFYNNIFASNPADLVCNANSAFKYSNVFSNSSCKINDYCEFATCEANVPFNLSTLRLSQGGVSSCGSIYDPGDYFLTKSLSTSAYLNASNPLASNVSCIKVFAPNVRIDCRGKEVNDSGYGIYLSTAFNTSISNCALTNDKYGIYADGALYPQLTNINLTDDSYGAYLKNLTGGRISKINMSNNTYGVYLNASFGVLFSQISAQRNFYGIYTGNGGSNIFNGGSAFSNTKSDFYCAPEEFNSSTDIMQNVQCGTTDCLWATCKIKVPPLEKAYPVISCMNITYPGRYALKQNVVGEGSCINIVSNDVIFDCASHTVSGNSAGSAVAISNANNVTLTNCNLTQFASGVAVKDSSQVDLSAINITNTPLGVSLLRTSLSNIAQVSVMDYGSYAFAFNSVNSSVITRNRASQGTGNADGFIFTNSEDNIVFFNDAENNPGHGFEFTDSKNNNIFNNSAFSNKGSDYFCSGSSMGLYSEPIGVNFGLSKSGCGWLVAVGQIASGPQCAALSSASQISITSDMFYTSGATCFSLYTAGSSSANDTEINCNGHLIYSNNGGRFVNVVNASNVHIENCVIVNFTTAISTSAQNTKIENVSLALDKNGIVLSGSKFAEVTNNKIENVTTGITIFNSTSASIFFNNMYNAAIGMNVSQSRNIEMENNKLTNGVSGLAMRSSILSTLKGNSFTNMVASGIACYGSSIGQSSSNLDQGGNSCSSNMNCTWTTSPACMP